MIELRSAPSGGGAARADVELIYASIGRGSPTNPNSLALLDGSTYAGTLIGTPSTQGLNGLTFTQDGRLWGSTDGFFGGRSNLIEIDLSGPSISGIAIVPIPEPTSIALAALLAALTPPRQPRHRTRTALLG